ncbi:hypothetical protein GCM10020358_67400 [Amorphoplanes nipponensis]|uniref:Uncharacterized protein n=1 Tax=Actinoplanes nipponensis TaxID=135950 RepID=A0A919MNJ2_9ACTN|nr:hypothetical protein Ani05nite_51700 [Actinoplanes nipponensis]
MVDRGPADQLLGDLWVAFVVAGQPAMGGEPRKGPFDDPSFPVNLEPALLGWLAHNVDHYVQGAAAQSSNRPAKP